MWSIDQAEFDKYTHQFNSLNPVHGFITGVQARDSFLKFGLPQHILVKVWNLSDVTQDGKLDTQEFCIAMHLIEKALKGIPLPDVIPDSMKVIPASSAVPFAPSMGLHSHLMDSFHPVLAPSIGGFSPPQFSVGQPLTGCPPPTGNQPLGANFSVHQTPSSVSKKVDWTLTNQTRLKYSQTFNVIDKQKVGYITGVQARNILSQSGLPNQILARIWNLADIDKDGRLSCNEYCVAMFLVDKMKSGDVLNLPDSLPYEILQYLPAKQRSLSIADSSGQIEDKSTVQPQFATTFEDKRRENYDKGQAELERRRLALLEQEKREREERDRKERIEAEKHERERLEAERKRQHELEIEMARQREEEAKREEEYKKAMEQREAARREIERQRQIELERQKLHDLIAQRQSEYESVLRAKQINSNLEDKLKGLHDRSSSLDSDITDVREQIVSITSSIENMKKNRDFKVAEMERNKTELNTSTQTSSRLQIELKALRDQLARLQGSTQQQVKKAVNERHQKSFELEKLRLALADLDRQIEKHSSSASVPNGEGKESRVKDLQRTVDNETMENRRLVEKLATLRSKLNEKRRKRMEKVVTGREQETIKYRALYEFVARSEDEISFQPDDIILVFRNHNGEPGWLAGQINDKVGWFPEAFAEPVVSQSPRTILSPQVSVSKLEPINEEAPVNSTTRNGVEPKISSSVDGTFVGTDDEKHHEKNGGVVVTSRTGITLYPYKARKDNQLSFGKGEMIKVSEMQEMWWFGEIDNKTGWFPKSYVKLNDESAVENLVKSPVVTESVQLPTRNKVANLSSKFDTVKISGQSTAKRQLSSESKWFISVYPFPEMEPGDLSFEAGDRILVTKQDGEWWTGECRGRTGVFPANYVQPELDVKRQEEPILTNEDYASVVKHEDRRKTLEHTESVKSGSLADSSSFDHNRDACDIVRVIAPYKAAGANQLSLEEGDWIKVRSRSPTGWWEGELHQSRISGKHAEKRIGWFPGNYVASVVKQHHSLDSVNSTDEKLHLHNQKTMVTVLFDYTAQQNDELTLNQGNVIELLDDSDSDWWRGKLPNGQQGLFPASYVQMTPDQQQQR